MIIFVLHASTQNTLRVCEIAACLVDFTAVCKH